MLWSLAACERTQQATSPTPEPQVSRVPHLPGEIVIRQAGWPAVPHWVDVAWNVPESRLASQPAWDGLTADPPLSAHAAITRATAACASLIPTSREWIVESISLENFGLYRSTDTQRIVGWCYAVTLRPADDHMYETVKAQGKLYQLTQVVLFDGQLVPQTITSLR